MSDTSRPAEKPTSDANPSGGDAGGEHLGATAEEQGIVDQQGALLDQMEDAGMDPGESANPT